MRECIAECLGIPVDRVGVKATTTERLGFVGTGEGISAHAVVLLGRCGSCRAGRAAYICLSQIGHHDHHHAC